MAKDSCDIFIGMGGWDLYPFNGIFYPPSQGKGFRKLAFYSHFLDCVEVNATFYNASFSRTQVSRWLHDVSENERFLFTVKLFRGFTHLFTATKGDALAISALLEQLEAGGRFAGLVAQFPVSFNNSPQHRRHLKAIIQTFKGHTTFVEVRHRSWNTPSTIAFLQDQEACLVNVDLPPLPSHMPLTSWNCKAGAYFRMMGRNAATWRQPWRVEEDGKHMVSDRYHYRYSENELHALARAISSKNERSRTIIIFHNDLHGNSLFNGFQLRTLLNPEAAPQFPKRLLQEFPTLSLSAPPT